MFDECESTTNVTKKGNLICDSSNEMGGENIIINKRTLNIQEEKKITFEEELEREERQAGEAQLRSTIEILKKERKEMEKKATMKMEEKTKRLRQACFKDNYNKRRLLLASTAEDYHTLYFVNNGVFEHLNEQKLQKKRF